MAARSILRVGLQILVVAVVYLILFLTTAGVGVPEDFAAQMEPSSAQRALSGTIAVSLLFAAVMAYLIHRSHWWGWRLALGVAFSFYGLQTFVQQIETAAFPAVASRLPAYFAISRMAIGIPVSLIFAMAAVWLMGKGSGRAEAGAVRNRMRLTRSEWAWKLGASIVLYEIVYFVFGYYVAWRTPGLPEFYGGEDPGTFFGQLANVMRDTPWLPALQAVRALLWTLFLFPIFRMLKGPLWETSLATGVILSILTAGQLIIPAPMWPEFVGRAHLIELATSNFVFGFLMSILWLRRASQVAAPPRTIGEVQGGLDRAATDTGLPVASRAEG